MHQVRDRKRLRREYLRRKSASTLGIGCVGYLFLGFLALSLLGAIGTGVASCYFLFQADLIRALLTLGLGAMLTLMPGGCAHACWCSIDAMKTRMNALSYVPPVTVDSLPIGETLVRASEEPPVPQSEVLLRAANEGETPKEELLRVAEE